MSETHFRGSLLKAWRESRNLTQAEAGEIVGMTQVFWGELERGAKQPSTDMLVHISKTTGISVDDLLGNPTGSPSRRGRAKDTEAA